MIFILTMLVCNIFSCACWYFIGKNVAELRQSRKSLDTFEEVCALLDDLERDGWIVSLGDDEEEEE